jgi:hypothetical protein
LVVKEFDIHFVVKGKSYCKVVSACGDVEMWRCGDVDMRRCGVISNRSFV